MSRSIKNHERQQDMQRGAELFFTRRHQNQPLPPFAEVRTRALPAVRSPGPHLRSPRAPQMLDETVDLLGAAGEAITHAMVERGGRARSGAQPAAWR